MSVQFGRWNFDGKPVDRDYLEKVKPVIAPYGPDDGGSYSKSNTSILYRAFHTTKESRREEQPHITASGAVVTWDGRLDNRPELIGDLTDVVTNGSTDVAIVAVAYERWGTDCFAHLIGDWALSIWNPNRRSLILAKDPIGTRQLYYLLDKDQVTWSTILDPLVLFAGKTFALEEEYIAGWLSFFPAAHFTPYVGIHSIPPSSSALIRAGNQTISKYWDFDPGKQIRYRTDAEYEEHFRIVFAEAVRRRLRSDSPVLAELSGGMDSSSIVCMADTVIGRGIAETPRLDTLSYYDDSEPNWDERPYFTAVEEIRGQRGYHIAVAFRDMATCEYEPDRFSALPASAIKPSAVEKQFSSYLSSQKDRVVLSGIGGDEVLGGVPSPTPELADLLVRARFRTLARGLKRWALTQRRPWFHLLFHTLKSFCPVHLTSSPRDRRLPSWLTTDFVKQHRLALLGYEQRLKFFGTLPSHQENLSALNTIRRQLSCSVPGAQPPYEKRYPYLDRDLLEFLYAIPREQIVRPGQRRSLMRRALKSLVPQEILQRKRKAFVAQDPLDYFRTESRSLSAMANGRLAAFVYRSRLQQAIKGAEEGQATPVIQLVRTLNLAAWLTHLTRWRVIEPSSEHTEIVASGASM